MTIKELKIKREELAKKQRKEYETRGNTQRCQELFAEIEKIEQLLDMDYEERRKENKKAIAKMF